jgi:hypothetical protein
VFELSDLFALQVLEYFRKKCLHRINYCPQRQLVISSVPKPICLAKKKSISIAGDGQ